MIQVDSSLLVFRPWRYSNHAWPHGNVPRHVVSRSAQQRKAGWGVSLGFLPVVGQEFLHLVVYHGRLYAKWVVGSG
jgi:hypothetical protein